MEILVGLFFSLWLLIFFKIRFNFFGILLLIFDNLFSKARSFLIDEIFDIDIDYLVLNAGLNRDNIFLRMSSEDWNDVINVNLNSSFYLLKYFKKKMVKKRFGRVARKIWAKGYRSGSSSEEMLGSSFDTSANSPN